MYHSAVNEACIASVSLSIDTTITAIFKIHLMSILIKSLYYYMGTTNILLCVHPATSTQKGVYTYFFRISFNLRYFGTY